jgi:predicted RNA-binding protein
MIDGKKYITKLKLKNGKKKNAGRLMDFLLVCLA